METVLVDANVILRFLLNDHPKLSSLAKSIFLKAQKGLIKIYLDEVVIAETVWTLSSFYKIKKTDLIDRLEKLISQSWVVNPEKKLILETLNLYRFSNLDYIDCWVLAVSQWQKVILETFDVALKRKIKSFSFNPSPESSI